jgi:hypothetical protein
MKTGIRAETNISAPQPDIEYSRGIDMKGIPHNSASIDSLTRFFTFFLANVFPCSIFHTPKCFRMKLELAERFKFEADAWWRQKTFLRQLPF